MNNDIKHIDLQYKQAVEEIELYSKLVISLRNELATAKKERTVLFDTRKMQTPEEIYLKRYPDVAKSGMSPKEHFERFGKILGRQWN